MTEAQFNLLLKRLTIIEEKINANKQLIVEVSKLTQSLSDKAVLTGDAAAEFDLLKKKVAALTDEIGA